MRSGILVLVVAAVVYHCAGLLVDFVYPAIQ